MEKIRIKYFTNIPTLEKFQVGDWIDLRAAEDTVIQSGDYKAIPLGVAMELPKGYEAIVAPRSSTFNNYGIIMVNSPGVVDETYKGDDDQWHFPAFAIHNCHIKKGERICQFRIQRHQPALELIEVESLNNENRGGLGSTGRK